MSESLLPDSESVESVESVRYASFSFLSDPALCCNTIGPFCDIFEVEVEVEAFFSSGNRRSRASGVGFEMKFSYFS